MLTSSPYQHLRTFMENSMENMHTDVRVYRVDDRMTFASESNITYVFILAFDRKIAMNF